ncbi:hypothetical protein BY996DRAFT_6414671 [Phakopsora pachyrhizi]|nr:hypothetical protein BY996DRAFT_6414671 [Phakopsora pachyrhizi]
MFLPPFKDLDREILEDNQPLESPSSEAASNTPDHELKRSMSERRLAHLIKTIPIKGGGSMPALIPAYDYSSGYVEAKKLSPKITKYAPRLQKRLIVCCDGTWNNGLSTSPFSSTNVLKLGNLNAFLNQKYHRLSRFELSSGATGAGVLTKIREAYAFIAQTISLVMRFWAFTARTIATLIADIGILTNAGMADFYQVLAAYQVRGKGNEKSEKAERFLDNYRRGGPKRMREMPEGTLKCVGVWDTVGAFGIPIHETRVDFMPTNGGNIHQHLEANLIEHKLLSIDEDYLLSLPAPKRLGTADTD